MSIDQKALLAAFDTIAQTGWGGWLADASPAIHPKTALFQHMTNWVWDELLTKMDTTLMPENPWNNRDVILELFMLKFESMRPFKPGLIILRQALFQHGGFGRYFLEAEYRAHQRMISHFSPQRDPSLIEQFQFHALFGLYLWAFEAYLQDDTSDLASTMALIDTQLQRGEKWLERYR